MPRRPLALSVLRDQAAGASDDAVYLLLIFLTGTLSQAMSNEPDAEWGTGRFTPLFPRLMELQVAAYPPARRRAPR